MKNNPLFFKERDFKGASEKMLMSINAKNYDQCYDDMTKIQINVYDTIQKY